MPNHNFVNDLDINWSFMHIHGCSMYSIRSHFEFLLSSLCIGCENTEKNMCYENFVCVHTNAHKCKTMIQYASIVYIQFVYDCRHFRVYQQSVYQNQFALTQTNSVSLHRKISYLCAKRRQLCSIGPNHYILFCISFISIWAALQHGSAKHIDRYLFIS